MNRGTTKRDPGRDVGGAGRAGARTPDRLAAGRTRIALSERLALCGLAALAVGHFQIGYPVAYPREKAIALASLVALVLLVAVARRSSWLGVFSAVAVAVAGLYLVNLPGAVVLVGLVACLPVLAGMSPVARMALHGMLAGWVCTGFLWTLLESSGLLVPGLSSLSYSLSFELKEAFGLSPELLGIKQAGVPAVVMLGATTLSAVLAVRPSADRAAWILLMSLFAAALTIALGAPQISITAASLVVLATTTRLGATHRVWPQPSRSLALSRRVWVPAGVTAAVVATVAALALASPSGGVVPESPRLTILTGGSKTTALTDDSSLAPRQLQAHFGALSRMLPIYGWDVDFISPGFDEASIRDTDILAVINPTSEPTPAELDSVEAFVRAGGGLLVLGDHTDLSGIQAPLDAYLGSTQIRFRFDSAIPHDPPNWRWRECLRGSWHRTFRRLQNDQLRISVGASLHTNWPARAVVIGDEGFSDWGDPDRGVSRLGNMSYDHGERRGSLVLVAEQRVGNGWVQAWGDTSGFQDLGLSMNHGGIARILSDLVARDPWVLSDGLLIGLLGVGAALVVIASALVPRYALVFLAVTLATSAGSYILPGVPGSGDSFVQPDYSRAHVLYTGSLPAYPEIDQTRSLSPLADIVLRTGSFLAYEDSLERAVASGPLSIVIVAPRVPIDQDEADLLFAYMNDGGRVLLVCGHELSGNAARLLDPLGVKISESMFGAAHRARVVPDAWDEFSPSGRAALPAETIADPIHEANEYFSPYDAEVPFKESHPIYSDDMEPLVECWGRPVVAAKRHGDGDLILVADSRFLNWENLYAGSSYAPRIERRGGRLLLRLLNYHHRDVQIPAE